MGMDIGSAIGEPFLWCLGLSGAAAADCRGPMRHKASLFVSTSYRNGNIASISLVQVEVEYFMAVTHRGPEKYHTCQDRQVMMKTGSSPTVRFANA